MRSIFANWITDGSGKPFYAIKKITLPSRPNKAEAAVCGLGQFNFYINGEKVSDHVLDPAWTDYHKLALYVKFDITSYLHSGENTFICEVGNGWYKADQEEGYFFHFPAFMPPNPNPYQPFDKELVLGFHAMINMEDGKEILVDADETWKTAIHPVQHSNVYGSEIYDGRVADALRMTDISAGIRIDECFWKKARIAQNGERLNAICTEQKIPPVRTIQTYQGVFLGTVHGRSIYDFGQNCAGMLEYETIGKRGQEVHAWPAEKLNKEGDVDQMAKNWLPIDVKETYIIGQNQRWEKFYMTFTYMGARYVAIDQPPERLRNVYLHAISSAGENAGTFECDDERYMQIYNLIEKSVEANMIGVHTDCPTIERFAWQEENHLMAPAIMYMKVVKPHWEKFLTDTRLAQLRKNDYFHNMNGGKYFPGDGLIPSQAPCYIPNVLPVPGLGDFYNVIGWGSSIILGTWWHYQFYGDQKIISDNYDAGKKYLHFLESKITEDGFINNGLGDWGNPSGEFAKENIETVFLYADAKCLEKFAKILEHTEDAADFSAYAEKVRSNYNEKLLVQNPETGKYCYRIWNKENLVMSQAAEAMPLYWGMVPDELVNDVVESFRNVLETDGCIKSGEVGQPYIIQTMNRFGMNELLTDFILKPQQPSYYAFVLDGMTTLGEYWEKNPRSHCHDMMGHIVEWYYNGIAGIQILEPGFRKVAIKPYMPESINHFVCTHRTPYGEIRVEGCRENGKPDYKITVPSEITVVQEG
ncbi:MAG: family 78 glycoside hydrolase catalytic domain [Bilifractor sp.]